MSLNSITGQKYGLIIPGKKEPTTRVLVQTAFVQSDSDEEDAEFKNPNFDVKLETIKANIRKSTKVNLEKALTEDPSVFLYDEVYDEINMMKNSKLLEKSQPAARKSKYVNNLLKVSAERKLEQELLMERKAQRELEEEKDKYGDKESFVTGAYKVKMSQIRKLVEQRKEEEAREEMMDVTKQDGLNGLYRFMYQQIATPADQAREKEQQNDKVSEEKEPNFAKKSNIYAKNIDKEATRSSKDSHPLQSHESSDSRRKNRSNSPRRSYRQEDVRHSDRERCKQVDRSRDERHWDSERSHHRSFRDVNRSDRVRYQDSDSISEKVNTSSSERRRDADRAAIRRNVDKSDNQRHRGIDHHKKSKSQGSHRKSASPSENNKDKKEVVEKRAKTPPGFIRAKPRHTTDEELAEAKKRFFARRESGIHADVVDTDDDE